MKVSLLSFYRFWQNQSLLRKSGAFLVSVFLLFMGIVFSYIMPCRERLLALEAQTRQQEEKNEQLEKYGLQDQRSRKLLLQEKYVLLQQKLPPGPEVGSFLLEVEQAARDSGVAIVQVRPREVQQEASWLQLPVELAARGSFQNMQLFLTSLGKLNRLAVLQSLVLQEQESFCFYLDLEAQHLPPSSQPVFAPAPQEPASYHRHRRS